MGPPGAKSMLTRRCRPADVDPQAKAPGTPPGALRIVAGRAAGYDPLISACFSSRGGAFFTYRSSQVSVSHIRCMIDSRAR